MLSARELVCCALQAAWIGTCLPEAARFRISATRSIEAIQAGTLREIMALAAGSDFARKYQLDCNTSVDEFRSRVPVMEYAWLHPWIERMAAGEENMLTCEKVLRFEETSGSTAGTRLIPYTRGLQQAFNRALHPWLFDLYSQVGSVWGGPAYWVVTPRTSMRRTAGGIPIGFANDSDYFGRWARPLVSALMAVPDEVKHCGEGPAWRYLTVLSLLRCERLRLVSLWNPSFFVALIRDIVAWSETLLEDLQRGTCSPERVGARVVIDLSRFRGRPMPERATLLAKALAALQNNDTFAFASLLWPKLDLISSWTEGEAAVGRNVLKQYFNWQRWQTKGLLATEGAVTIPMLGTQGAVLAARSAFFEFECGETGEGQIKLAHELELHKRYRVIMTTFGGLYRYRLHDIVQTCSYWNSMPTFTFVGKESMVNDISGEKINTGHLRQIVKRLPGDYTGAFFAPERPFEPELPGYLFVAAASGTRLPELELAKLIEEYLCENIHYRWCREAGQLQAIKVMLLPVAPAEIPQLRRKRDEETGRVLSTAKYGLLSRDIGWHNWLSRYINSAD